MRMTVIISPGHVEANEINTSKVLAHSKHSKNKTVLCEKRISSALSKKKGKTYGSALSSPRRQGSVGSRTLWVSCSNSVLTLISFFSTQRRSTFKEGTVSCSFLVTLGSLTCNRHKTSAQSIFTKLIEQINFLSLASMHSRYQKEAGCTKSSKGDMSLRLQ